jgi:hypothetical protein
MMMMMKSSIPTTGSHDSDVDVVDVEMLAPLTRSKMIQERSSSSFGDNLGILFYDDPNPDHNDNKQRLRPRNNSDVRELAIGVLMFVTGWYGPRYILLPYLFAASLDQNPPPFQTTKAGDVIVDFLLNQPLVDPPTIPGA